MQFIPILRQVISEKLSALSFLRITEVRADRKDYICSKIFSSHCEMKELPAREGGNIVTIDFKQEEEKVYYTFLGNAKVVEGIRLDTTIPSQNAQNILHYYKNFTFKAESNRKLMSGDNTNRYSFDMNTFDFIEAKDKNILPAPKNNKFQGDLICCIITNGEIKKWAYCSEQFYHMVVAVTNRHVPEIKKEGKTITSEKEYRELLFRGNYLSTNSFKKWILANKNEMSETVDPTNPIFDKEECRKRFYKRKDDDKHVHIYAALVLFLRYGEFMSDKNFPRNIRGANMNFWDVPTYNFGQTNYIEYLSKSIMRV